jgi:hypothetical protein
VATEKARLTVGCILKYLIYLRQRKLEFFLDQHEGPAPTQLSHRVTSSVFDSSHGLAMMPNVLAALKSK